MNTKRVAILDFAVLYLLSLLGYATELVVSPMALVIMLFAPFPFFVLERRYGPYICAIAAGCGALFYSLLGGFPVGSVYFGLFGLTGIAFGVISEKCESAGEYMMLATGFGTVVKLAITVAFIRLYNVNPFGISGEVSDTIMKSLETSVTDGAVSSESMKQYVTESLNMISTLTPSLIIIFSAAEAFFSYVFASRALIRRGVVLPVFPNIGFWKLPKSIGVAIFAAIILQLINGVGVKSGYLFSASENLSTVLRMMLTVEGISVCWHFMTRRNVPPIFKSLIALFMFIILPLSYIVSMIGVFDIWYDLRKLGGNKDESDS